MKRQESIVAIEPHPVGSGSWALRIVTSLSGPEDGKHHTFAWCFRVPKRKQEDRWATSLLVWDARLLSVRRSCRWSWSQGYTQPTVGLPGVSILSWSVITSCLQDEQWEFESMLLRKMGGCSSGNVMGHVGCDGAVCGYQERGPKRWITRVSRQFLAFRLSSIQTSE